MGSLQASPALTAGGSVAALEAALVALLPAGPVRVLAQVLVPVLVGAVVHWWNQKGKALADLAQLNQAVSDLQAATAAVSTEVAQLKVDATSQASVDAVTASVQSVTASLQALAQPTA